jgi:hypothetical protein
MARRLPEMSVMENFHRQTLTFNPNMTFGHDDLLPRIWRQGPDSVPFFGNNSFD